MGAHEVLHFDIGLMGGDAQDNNTLVEKSEQIYMMINLKYHV